MAKIHSLVYIVVGLFVSLMSWKLNYEKLMFFFYVGLIFALVGIFKLAFGLKKKDKRMDVHKEHHQMPKTNMQQAKYCHQCGAQLSPHHRFCPRCGARV